MAPTEHHRNSLIVIGNGTSLIEKEHGALIDAFDDVLRFNAYKTEGHEACTGTKTTIWFNVIPFQNKRHPLILKPYRSVYLHSWQWDREKCKLWQALSPVFSCPVSKVERGTILELQEYAQDQDYFPYSSGMIAIWLMLKSHPRITITGFDWWEREKHHYSDNAVRGTLHKPEKEFRVIQKLQRDGRLEFLKEE
ncbi:MAG TPA: hypothetical protein DDZ88_16340 [Verrucomicrobiales bacterium]|nr:hypothetical protein [Verrucomicrobiales bacterium]